LVAANAAPDTLKRINKAKIRIADNIFSWYPSCRMWNISHERVQQKITFVNKKRCVYNKGVNDLGAFPF